MKLKWLVVCGVVFLAVLFMDFATVYAGLELGISGSYFLPLSWKDTYDVVYGNSGTPGIMLHCSYVFSSPFSLCFSAAYFTQSGHSVWPSEEGGWEQSESIDFQMIPLSLTFEWHPLLDQRILPYAGLGCSYVLFKETDAEQNASSGYVVNTGFDCLISERTRWFLEGRYSSYPDSLGDAGVSQFFDESDIGGVVVLTGLKWHF